MGSVRSFLELSVISLTTLVLLSARNDIHHGTSLQLPYVCTGCPEIAGIMVDATALSLGEVTNEFMLIKQSKDFL